LNGETSISGSWAERFLHTNVWSCVGRIARVSDFTAGRWVARLWCVETFRLSGLVVDLAVNILATSWWAERSECAISAGGIARSGFTNGFRNTFWFCCATIWIRSVGVGVLAEGSRTIDRTSLVDCDASEVSETLLLNTEVVGASGNLGFNTRSSVDIAIACYTSVVLANINGITLSGCGIASGGQAGRERGVTNDRSVDATTVTCNQRLALVFNTSDVVNEENVGASLVW